MFADHLGIECESAGLSPDADNPLTDDLVEWADIIFVMEKVHRAKLSQRFSRHLKRARVVCLDIADDYELMDPRLIAILNAKVRPLLPR